ncbi:hypothetical protein [Natranaerofaba carboxydovora]|uniref:hypothetical protein n=1 Tax=Natranaerofaba carboxydovora TaxID=2742683 RepID=UPI001F1453DD|nr:hypothetical protein [Natranaerofaba carboxydovora]UMZ74581.1 hypothetical protein ACONDI_02177 [Natranaerofaba carboxydovora]
MKKILKMGFVIVLTSIFAMALFLGCGEEKFYDGFEVWNIEDLSENEQGERVISDKAYELDGETVVFDGWMSPISPFRENHFYLINTPSESCPFCEGEEVDYMDVMIVLLPQGEYLRFTFEPLRIKGVLEVNEETKSIDDHGESHFSISVSSMDHIEKIEQE